MVTGDNMSKNAEKTLGLLKLALNNANSDPTLSETRHYIQQAVTKLEHAIQRDMRAKGQSQTNYDKWWGKIVAGTAKSPTSPQAAVRSLKELDAMISAEQKNLNELEMKIQHKAKTPDLLQD